MISAYIYNTNRDICVNIPIYLNSKSESLNNTINGSSSIVMGKN